MIPRKQAIRPVYQLVLVALAGMLLQTGCGPTRGQQMTQEGASVEYGRGFDDGCSSGKKAAGDMFSQFRKNVGLYQQNADYRLGWNDGHEECMNEWRSMQRQQELGIEQQRAHDEHTRLERQEQKDMIQNALPRLDREQIDNLNKLGH
ncbi:MAG TPA: hypothetical protein ENI89_12290 [Desulfobulbus sp.]|nr:hypothetical protein [Desulfobulbus sp.]